jgi:hypothetical protein
VKYWRDCETIWTQKNRRKKTTPVRESRREGGFKTRLCGEPCMKGYSGTSSEHPEVRAGSAVGTGSMKPRWRLTRMAGSIQVCAVKRKHISPSAVTAGIRCAFWSRLPLPKSSLRFRRTFWHAQRNSRRKRRRISRCERGAGVPLQLLLRH